MNSQLATVLLLIGPSLAIGCGSGSKGQPQLGSVSGKVTLDGTPLEGVSVAFGPKQGRTAMGLTDKNGHYKLIYLGRTQGAKVGENKVVISTPVDEEADAVVEERIPRQYNAETTLSVEVKPGRNTFNFDLKSLQNEQIAMPAGR